MISHRDAKHLLEAARNEALHEPHNAVCICPCHLHVQLCELWLPVGTQIFIAKAARNLRRTMGM
jgi:hypothetical protein